MTSESGKSQEKSESLTAVEKADDASQALPVEVVEILERLPPEERQELVSDIQRIVALYSGPVPHAGEMALYRTIDPSFPERFMSMYERQSAHRQTMEAAVVEAENKINEYDFRLKRRGQDYALMSVVVGLGTSLIFALIGATNVAGIVGGTTVVGVVAAFVAGRVTQNKSRDQNDEAD